MAMGNMHKKWKRSDVYFQIHTDTVITILRSLIGGGVKIIVAVKSNDFRLSDICTKSFCSQKMSNRMPIHTRCFQ